MALQGEKPGAAEEEGGNQERQMEEMRARFGEMSNALILGLLAAGDVFGHEEGLRPIMGHQERSALPCPAPVRGSPPAPQQAGRC